MPLLRFKKILLLTHTRPSEAHQTDGTRARKRVLAYRITVMRMPTHNTGRDAHQQQELLPNDDDDGRKTTADRVARIGEHTPSGPPQCPINRGTP